MMFIFILALCVRWQCLQRLGSDGGLFYNVFMILNNTTSEVMMCIGYVVKWFVCVGNSE
jgi:hypothetical protein